MQSLRVVTYNVQRWACLERIVAALEGLRGKGPGGEGLGGGRARVSNKVVTRENHTLQWENMQPSEAKRSSR